MLIQGILRLLTESVCLHFRQVQMKDASSAQVKGDEVMITATDDLLRLDVSDEELEVIAEETALSYTYQTSAYARCCN